MSVNKNVIHPLESMREDLTKKDRPVLTVTLTTFLISLPAVSRIDFRFLMQLSVFWAMVPEVNTPFESVGSCPEQNTSSEVLTAWLYGPAARYTLSQSEAESKEQADTARG